MKGYLQEQKVARKPEKKPLILKQASHKIEQKKFTIIMQEYNGTIQLLETYNIYHQT